MLCRLQQPVVYVKQFSSNRAARCTAPASRPYSLPVCRMSVQCCMSYFSNHMTHIHIISGIHNIGELRILNKHRNVSNDSAQLRSTYSVTHRATRYKWSNCNVEHMFCENMQHVDGKTWCFHCVDDPNDKCAHKQRCISMFTTCSPTQHMCLTKQQ